MIIFEKIEGLGIEANYSASNYRLLLDYFESLGYETNEFARIYPYGNGGWLGIQQGYITYPQEGRGGRFVYRTTQEFLEEKDQIIFLS